MRLDHEKLLSQIHKMSDSLHHLQDGYVKIIDLIEEEHQYVKSSDLLSIETLISQKSEIGEVIANSGSELMEIFDALISELKNFGLLDKNQKVSFTEALEVIQNECSRYQDAPLSAQVLLHEIVKVREHYLNLQESRKKSNHKIEMNQYLIRKLLHHHQETFRFWQTLAAESEATYGAEGTAKSQKSGSTIIVRT